MTATSPLTLHLLQPIATPHNNSLVRALRREPGVHVVTWYARRSSALLPWKSQLADGQDNFFLEDRSAQLRLLWEVLKPRQPHVHFLAVGYHTLGTRLVILSSWLTGHDFGFWTDNPIEKQRTPLRRALNRVAWTMVQQRANPLFVAGQHTKERFIQKGFGAHQLVNLPICIDVPDLPAGGEEQRLAVRQHYGIPEGRLLLVGASRLAREKGYDLLLQALAQLPNQVRQRIQTLIVGSGPEEDNLKQQALELGLSDEVAFASWMEPDEYQRVLAATDIFVHPARFDAFGGGTLYAMAMGLPVIGSNRAGSALERITDGHDGLLYPPEDLAALQRAITRLVEDDEFRHTLANNARQTAEHWQPQRAVEILLGALRQRN